VNISAAFRGREASTGLDAARPAAGQLGGAEGRGTRAGLAEDDRDRAEHGLQRVRPGQLLAGGMQDQIPG
jgi:hypothetical protein